MNRLANDGPIIRPSAPDGWFNDEEYSDLTLKLRDRELKAHKLVICKRSKYFDRLCGSTSSFKESKQSVIELKEDDPDAVEEVIRKLYGCRYCRRSSSYFDKAKEWRYWFNLIITADKYLEDELRTEALFRLRLAASCAEDAEVVLDIMHAIKHEDCPEPLPESLLNLGEQLRKDNAKALLKNERYRDLLANDKDLMLKQLDELEVPSVPKKQHALY